MPNIIGPNENITRSTRTSKRIYYNQSLEQTNTAIGYENVFHFNFVKVSCYSTSAVSITFTFHPEFIYNRIVQGQTKLTSPITTLKTETFTVPANTYKFFTFPVQGEYMSGLITAADISTEEHTYLKICYVDYSTITIKE